PPLPADSPPGDAAPCAGAGAADAELGLDAARRALRIDGTLPRLRDPLVIQLESPATIAAGERVWGIAPYLAAAGGQLLRITPDQDSDAEALAAADRQVVVLSRDTHRRPYARRLVEQLAASNPQVVLVEMGWPGSWRPAGLRGYLATYGASQASARAAAEALLAN
ncbi:MAG: glycoside hydrolase family 3 protein, partial [Micromonosporaceae bacterium]